MGKSDFLENEVLKWCAGLPNFLDDGVIVPWLGLVTTLPADSGAGGVEVPTTNGYTRVNVAGKMAIDSAGVMKNTAKIDFATPTGTGWGLVKGWVLYTAQTNGSLLRYFPLATQKTLAAGDPASFAAGELIWRED